MTAPGINDWETIAAALVNEAAEQFRQLQEERLTRLAPPRMDGDATRLAAVVADIHTDRDLESEQLWLELRTDMLHRAHGALTSIDHEGHEAHRHKLRQHAARLQEHLTRLREHLAQLRGKKG